MKIYTKTGDSGTTGLIGGTRLPKHDSRIECYGTIDELNSYLGLIRDQEIPNNSKVIIINIQKQLFAMGAILAMDPVIQKKPKGKRFQTPVLKPEATTLLETEIDAMNITLPPLTHFILPGGHSTVSYCHIARSICRRAERITTKPNSKQPVPTEVLIYLNRLSDFLFVLARKLSKDLKAEEIKWIPKKPTNSRS